MIIKNIYAVYFSPTGGTQKIAEALSNDLSQLLHIPFQNIDFTILANFVRCFYSMLIHK